jgi:hypothetical protein
VIANNFELSSPTVQNIKSIDKKLKTLCDSTFNKVLLLSFWCSGRYEYVVKQDAGFRTNIPVYKDQY